MAQTTQWSPAILDEECDVEHINVPSLPPVYVDIGIMHLLEARYQRPKSKCGTDSFDNKKMCAFQDAKGHAHKIKHKIHIKHVKYTTN